MDSGKMLLNIDNFNASDDFRHAQAVAIASSKKLSEYARLVEDDDEIDENYKVICLCILHGEERRESHYKRKSRDDDGEFSMMALRDPLYESFLDHLKEHGKSYVLQCERGGSSVAYGYEENIGLEKECDLEPKMSGGVTGHQIATSNQTCGIGNQVKQHQGSDLDKKIRKWSQRNSTRENDKVEEAKGSPLDTIQDTESLSLCKDAKGKDELDIRTSNCNTTANEKVHGLNGGNKGRKRKFSEASELGIECSNEMPGGENQHMHNPQQSAVKKINVVIPSKSSTNGAKMLENVMSSPNHVAPVPEIVCSDKMPGLENQDKHNPQRTSVKKINDVIPRKPSNSGAKILENVISSPNHVAPVPEIVCSDKMPGLENQDKHNPQWISVKKINDVIPRKPSNSGAKMLANVRISPDQVVPVPEYLHHRQNVENKMNNTVGVSNWIQGQREFGSTVDQRIDLMPGAENQCNHDLWSAADKATKSLTRRKTRNDDEKVENITGLPINKVTMEKKICKNVRLEENINLPNVHTMVNQNISGSNSQKKQGRLESSRDVRLKVGLSNETSAAKNRCGHDLQPASVLNSKSLTMGKSRNKAENDDIVKCSYNDFMGVRAAKSFRDEESEDEMTSDVKMFDKSEKPGALLERNEFRKQVLDYLRRPFDKEEYLRYQEDARGGSYYNYHEDLARKLKKYRYNQRKRLTIFRGFFFWLENLAQEGAFKPWKNRECLEVEPGSAEDLSFML